MRAIFAAMFSLLCATASINAQIYDWAAGSGNWTVPSNWSPAEQPVPSSTTALIFGSNTTYTATNNFTNLPAFYFQTLVFSNTAGTVTVDGPAALPNVMPLRPSTLFSTGLSFYNPGSRNLLLPINVSSHQLVVSSVFSDSGTVTFGSSTSDIGSFLIGTGSKSIFNASPNPVLIGNLQEHFQGTLLLSDGPFLAARSGGNLFGEQTKVIVNTTAVLDLNNNGEDMGVITGFGVVQQGTANLSFRAVGSHTFGGIFQGTGNITARAGRAGPGTTFWQGTSTTSGNITIENGILDLSENGALPNANAFTIANGARLRLDNTSTVIANRMRDAAAFSLAGALQLDGPNAVAVSETIGAVTVGTTAGSQIVAVPGSGGSANWTMASLARGGRGSLLNFNGPLGSFTISTPPTLINGIIGGYATYGPNWATMSGTTVVPLATYQTSNDPSLWAATDNVLVSAPLLAPTGSRTINSLKINNQSVDLGGGALVLTSNGILTQGPTNSIANGTIRGASATNPELAITVADGGTLDISAQIINTGTQSVVKSGPGTLVLSNTNNLHSGGTRVYGGVLSISNNGSLGSNVAANSLTVAQAEVIFNGDFSSNARNLVINGSTATLNVTLNNIAFFNSITDTNDSGHLVKLGTGTLIGNAGGLNGNITIVDGTMQASGGPFGTAGDAIDNQTILTLATPTSIFDDSFGNGEDMGFLSGDGEFRMRGDVAVGLRLMNDPRFPFSTFFNGVISTYVDGVPSTLPAAVHFGSGTATTGSGGEIALAGPSTYSGPTVINYGTVVLNANVLPGVDGPFGNPDVPNRLVQIGNVTNNSQTNAALFLNGTTFGRDILVRDSTTPGQAYGVVTLGSLNGVSNFNGNITLNRALEVDIRNFSTLANFAGVISGSGSLVKIGFGDAYMTHPTGNTYTGGTIITEGRLVALNASGSATGTGNVTVAGSGMLAGTGIVAPAPGNIILVAPYGRIRGDYGTGTGELVLGANSIVRQFAVIQVQLDAPTPVIDANSKINIGAFTMNFVPSGNPFEIILNGDENLALFTPYSIVIAKSGGPNQFLLFGTPYDSVLNPFIPLADFVVFSGSGTQTYDFLSLTVDPSNNLVLNFTPIPEPACMMLAGLAAAAAWRLRRRGAVMAS